MSKAEYLESQRGKTYSVIVAEQPMQSVVGSIRGANLRDVVSVLAGGLQYRLDNAPDSPLRTALLVAFNHLSLPDYAINLALPENVGMLQAAVADGLVTQAESDRFFELATYQRPLHSITREDCAQYFNPDWSETEETSTNQFTITLTDRAPEMTYIVIQHQDAQGYWEHATALHGVLSARTYSATVPYYGTPRKLRWRCEYVVTVA